MAFRVYAHTPEFRTVSDTMFEANADHGWFSLFQDITLVVDRRTFTQIVSAYQNFRFI